MKKKATPAIERRRQKKIIQKQVQRKEKQRLAKSQAKPIKIPDVETRTFSDAQWVFWLAHGVNYLISDYDKGLWTPLFTGIYETPPRLPTPEEIAQGVMGKYHDTKEWPLEAKAALAWTVSDRKLIFVYYLESLRRTRGEQPEVDVEALVREPHNPQVWSVFNFLKQKILHRRR